MLNLVPLGYTDGTMLLHLILRTRRGKELISRILHSEKRHAAEEREAVADYQDGAAHRRRALEHLLEAGEADPTRLAAEYAGLGRMETAAQEWREAEKHLRQALDLSAKGAANASRDGNCWACLHRLYLYRQDAANAEAAYRNAVDANETLRPSLRDPGGRLTLQLSVAELHQHAHAFGTALAEVERALDAFPAQREYRFIKGKFLKIRAHAALQLGNPELGLVTADEAADIFRTDKDSEGTTALQQLGLVGWSLWEGGQSEQAETLVTECIRLLELRGAMDLAARFRLCLAQILCADGRTAEAGNALPVQERMGRGFRRQYLIQRGAIRGRAGQWADSLQDAAEELSLTLEDAPEDEMAIAIARSALAEAHLDAGQPVEAEAAVQQAYAELTALNHSARAQSAITLAIVCSQKGQPTGAYFEEAIQVWAEAPLILPAGKARLLEATAERFDRAGLPEEAARCRDAARQHWHRLTRPAEREQYEKQHACAVW